MFMETKQVQMRKVNGSRTGADEKGIRKPNRQVQVRKVYGNKTGVGEKGIQKQNRCR
jgi:hypothetical protein